ncbi:MAG: FecR domain-containing protein [Elusimicrobia bacterium]|nr:FecR domain-containing protein [Elusimicrobiota bacterium]
MRLITIVSLIAILFSSPAAAAVSLSKASGKIFFLKAGATVWAQVSAGHILSPGDRVRADAGAKATVDFGDGSRVEIGSNASFTLQAARPQETTVQFSIGRLRAWVAKRMGQKFTVRTPTAVCSVRGTEFAVEVNAAGNTRVEMFEGLLAVADNRGNEVLLKDNQQLDVTTKGLGAVEGQGAAPPGADARKEAAKREVGLDMSKEDVQAAAAIEQKAAIYQQGKAIIDVNGHRVRIEEYIVRSRPEEFKLVVLNSRVDRFDYFYYKGVFNKTLPDDISVALRQLPGCINTACEYYLTSYDTARSNTQDNMREVATGGHLQDVNNNNENAAQGDLDGSGAVDAADFDDVLAAFDPATDKYTYLSVPNVGGAGNQPFYKTLFNTNSLTFNGVTHGGWTPAAAVLLPANWWKPAGMTVDGPYTKNDVIGGGQATALTGAAITTVRRMPACGPPNCTYLENGTMHDVIYADSNDGKTWEKYDSYVISDEGKVANWSDFSGITSGAQYKQILLNWNFQMIVTASEFEGRKIDLAVEPKIFIQSGLIP